MPLSWDKVVSTETAKKMEDIKKLKRVQLYFQTSREFFGKSLLKLFLSERKETTKPTDKAKFFCVIMHTCNLVRGRLGVSSGG